MQHNTGDSYLTTSSYAPTKSHYITDRDWTWKPRLNQDYWWRSGIFSILPLPNSISHHFFNLKWQMQQHHTTVRSCTNTIMTCIRQYKHNQNLNLSMVLNSVTATSLHPYLAHTHCGIMFKTFCNMVQPLPFNPWQKRKEPATVSRSFRKATKSWQNKWQHNYTNSLPKM